MVEPVESLIPELQPRLRLRFGPIWDALVGSPVVMSPWTTTQDSRCSAFEASTEESMGEMLVSYLPSMNAIWDAGQVNGEHAPDACLGRTLSEYGGNPLGRECVGRQPT